ncbi:MAG: hypothetical protein U0670_21845 [Anaerolineae bacterium]
MHRFKRVFVIRLLMLSMLLLIGHAVAAQESTPEPTEDAAGSGSDVSTTWVPIGGGYTTTFPGFLQAALPNVERFETSRLYLLMLPIAYSYAVDTLSMDDLLLNTQDADYRRRQLEDECRLEVPQGVLCEVAVPPVYTREAANSDQLDTYFTDDLAGVYFLGGDQTIAMQITAGSRLEGLLRDAFERGVVMGGNSAGLAIESRTMIGGYGGDAFGPENGLALGAVDLWNDDQRRGMDFGVTTAVLEQHTFERARLARLLNAIVQENAPGVGIGIDSYTGALIRDNRVLEAPFGSYAGVIFDVETLNARATARFDNPASTLSIRNVLMHTFGAGNFSYDLTTRSTSAAAPPTQVSRDFNTLAVPTGAGTLILFGNLSDHMDLLPESVRASHAIALAFNVLGNVAENALADDYAGTNTDLFFIGDDGEIPDLSAYDTVIVHAHDALQIDIDALRASLQDAWLGGKTIVLDDAAAVLVGQQYTAMPSNDTINNDATFEAAVQGIMLDGQAVLADGLGFLPITLETRLMADNRWGRWFALAYHNPQEISIGLPDDAFLTIDSSGAVAGGTNSVLVLDLRDASLSLAASGAYQIVNGLFDAFAPGELLTPAQD